MIRRPPRSTLSSSSAASDVYKRQVAGEVDAFAVADDRVEGAGGLFEHHAPRRDAKSVGAVPAEGGEVDDLADDRGRAGDPAVRVELPANAAGAGVERVEGAVVGAEVDRGAAVGRVRGGGRCVDVGAGLHRPVEAAGEGVVGVDAPVGVAEVDAAVDDGCGGVEGAAAEQ